MKAYNIRDKAQHRSLFLDSIGEATHDIFRQLGSTETDLDRSHQRATKQVKEITKPVVQHTKISLRQQGEDKTFHSFISRLRAEGEHCEFLAGWLDTQILMAMIENGLSKRVKRKLLQVRVLESADQHATKVESQTPPEVTIKQEVDKITTYRGREKLCFNCGKHCPHLHRLPI